MKTVFLFTALYLLQSFPTVASESASAKFQFLSSFNVFKKISAFRNAQYGGISAIDYDPKSQKLYALSDDKNRHAENRIFVFKVNVSENRVNFEPDGLFFLKKQNRKSFALLELDTEGLRLTSQGKFLVSTEGGRKLSINLSKSEIHLFSSTGSRESSLQIPTIFHPNSNLFNTRGTRNNKGFEGLGLTPDEKFLFTANEKPLRQDGNKDGKIRILRFKKSLGTYIPDKQWAYQPGKIIKDEKIQKNKKTGVSEILALGPEKIWILERTDLKGRNFQNNLYKAETGSASNIADIESIKNKNILAIQKIELLDITKSLSEMGQKGDNMEGMTIGPKLDNGNHTLIMANDNDFEKDIESRFFIFEILSRESQKILNKL